MSEKQTNYTIAEGFVLPSRGIIYDREVNPNVELRSMTARDEMKRLAPTNTPFKLLSDIIEGCMLEKPAIHVYDMALADYEFLLHRLRVVTYGDEYNISITCPNCNAQFSSTTHLDQMQNKVLEESEWQELHTITLPKNGDTLVLNIQTPRMIEEAETMAKEFKRKFKDASLNFETLASLMLTIDSVNGQKLSNIQLQNYIDRLSAYDMQKIENQRVKLNSAFGLTNKIEVTCPHCGEEISTFFRFGTEFFRPSNI